MAPETAKRLTKVLEAITGAEQSDDHIKYEKLSRPEQNVLIRLFGGGTLRNADEAALSLLLKNELISDGKLTARGEEVCREALPAIRERIGERFI